MVIDFKFEDFCGDRTMKHGDEKVSYSVGWEWDKSLPQSKSQRYNKNHNSCPIIFYLHLKFEKCYFIFTL